MNWAKKILNKIEKTPTIYLFTAIILLGFIVYGNSLFNNFVWDDEEQILNNGIIREITNIPYLFTSSTFNTGGAGLSGWYYKPLMPISFALTNAVFGLMPFGFHFVSLTLHIINSILVFIFFKKIFDLKKYAYSKSTSFILSLLFLTHPANVESVAYASSTQELLYVLFILLSVIFTISYISSSIKEKQKILLINFFVFLSLLSKESGIISIPVIIFLIFLFRKEKIKTFAVTLLLTLIAYLVFRFPIAKTPLFQHSLIIPIANASLFQRIITIPYELASYLRLLVFPNDLFVAQHVVINNIKDPRFYVSTIILAMLFSFTFFLFKKSHDKVTVFFIAWILFSFLLILNIYPLDMTIAERWLYGPMIGILGLLGIAILEIIKKNEKMKTYFSIASILIVLIFSIRVVLRNADWNNNMSLFSHDINYSAESFDAQNNLGVALFRNGDLKDAKNHFEKSIELSPFWWTPYNNLGVIYQREGKIEEAKKLYAKSIKEGNYYMAY